MAVTALTLWGFRLGDHIVLSSAFLISIETVFTRVELRRSPLTLTWSFRADETAAFQPVPQDRATQAYCFERTGPRFVHYPVRDPRDHYYGFGEKSGDANKHGRRLRMRATDALGYDAESSDPLYKHVPFYITVRPAAGAPVGGLFYDNLSHGAFDLGREIDAYHGPYRSFEACDGDLDLYLMFGRRVSDVVAQFSALTGRNAFPPRWSLSYSGSTMQYTEAADAERSSGVPGAASGPSDSMPVLPPLLGLYEARR